MAAQISGTKPLHVKRICFANGDVLEDKAVFMARGFLIVEAESEDHAPTWYNLRNVEQLQEVTIPRPQGTKQPCIVDFL